MSRILSCAVALFAFASCGGWSLFGSDEPAKPQPAATKTDAAPASQTPLPASPMEAVPSGPATIDAALLRAQTLRAQGNYAEATKGLAQLMLGDPDDARVVGEYGKTLAQEGESKDAIAFLTRATQLRNNDWTLYSALGVAYDQTDDHKDARTAYERALSLHPNEPSVLNNYAVSRMLAGDLDGAQALLDQAKAAGGMNPKIASNLDALTKLRAAKAPSVASLPGKPAMSQSHVAIANTAPKATPLPVGNGAAPAQAGTVMMQAVPFDSKAGPVAVATKEPRRLAMPVPPAPKTKVVAKPAPKKSSAPVLRTADQGE